MIKINYEALAENAPYQKNKLYKINESEIIQFKEEQKDKDCSDLVKLKYSLKEQQYGVFAHEYRNPNTAKRGGKSADILACIIDDKNKKIYTTILDVKHNISAFSDNLLNDGAMLTAIKDIRDFIEQIHAEILHKNSFLLFYKDEDYIETERIGIATTNFDSDKFIKVSELLEQLFEKENDDMPLLVSLKLKNALNPYKGEIAKIRDFANQKVTIGKNRYDLEVFILKKISNSEYVTSIEIADDKELE